MRVAALIAVSLLVAGCSHTVGGQSGQTQTSPGSSPSTPAPSGGKSPRRPPHRPPAPRSPTSSRGSRRAIPPIRAAITARRATAPPRHSVTTSPSPATAGKASCTTDSKHTGGALACLVSLTSPPPQPDTAYGKWQGGWVDFDGTKLQVGAARADPGPFVNGDGPELANGDTLVVRRLPLPRRPSGTVLRELRTPVGGAVRPRRHPAVRLPAIGAAAGRRRYRVQLLTSGPTSHPSSARRPEVRAVRRSCARRARRRRSPRC